MKRPPFSASASRRFRFSTSGSSLITTLLVITVLTIIVVAFMQSMSIERMTSRSYANMERAQLAAQAGVNDAMARISFATGTNQAYVTGQFQTNGLPPTLVIGRSDLTNQSQLIPLVSGDFSILRQYPANDPSGFLTFIGARLGNSTSTVNLNQGVGSTNYWIQNTADENLYRAPWVDLTNSRGVVTGRFAFVVVDEASKLNPFFHGGNLSRTNATNWFQGPGEIPLVTGNPALFSTNEANALRDIAGREGDLQSIAQAFATRDAYEQKKHLITLDKSPVPEIIPSGFPQAGSAKFNVNDLATNSVFGATFAERAENIAEIINANLPDFKTRDPSLRTLSAVSQMRYLHRLAANLVSYISPPGAVVPTPNGEPSGRGLVPLTVALAERYRRVAYSPATDPATTRFENQVFLQIWNPYTQTIDLSGTARILVQNRMRLTFGTGIVTPFQDYDETISVNGISVRPNEFIVLEFPTVTQEWSSPGPVKDPPQFASGSPGNSADQTTHSHFTFFLNNQLVDMNRRTPVGPGTANAGMPRNTRAFTTAGNNWQASFSPTETGLGGRRSVSDPRSHYLSNYEWRSVSADTTYATSTFWKGRQNLPANNPRSQDLSVLWEARDYVRANPVAGAAPGGINNSPASVISPWTSASAPDAPAYLASRAMNSIGELGHIFDPVQADDSGASPSGGTPSSPFASNGGRTLRIGQPEFTFASHTWNTNGRRAIELVDLFSTRPASTNFSNFPVSYGRINLNTAPSEVLEALFFGIGLRSDGGAPDNQISLTNAANLAQFVITNRPYNRLSDLHRLTSFLMQGTNYTPPLPTVGVAPQLNLALMDRAREETLGKILEHVTVQSRAFRIFSIGQALDSNGRVVSQALTEVLVSLPVDLDGAPMPRIINQH